MSIRGHHGLLLAAIGGGGGGGIEVLAQGFAAATSHNVSMPSAVASGAILIVAVANGSSNSGSMVTTPSGWTLLGTIRESTNATRLTMYYKTAAGTEGGTTVNFVTGASAQMAATVWHFPPGTLTGTPEAQFGTSSGASPASPAISPTWGAVAGTHGISIVAFGLNTISVSVFPYATQNKFITGGASPYSNMASCMTTFGGATLTPTAYTLSGSVQYVAATIALRA